MSPVSASSTSRFSAFRSGQSSGRRNGVSSLGIGLITFRVVARRGDVLLILITEWKNLAHCLRVNLKPLSSHFFRHDMSLAHIVPVEFRDAGSHCGDRGVWVAVELEMIGSKTVPPAVRLPR